MKFLVSVLVFVLSIVRARAGDPAFCDQYKITKIILGGLECSPLQENLNLVSDFGSTGFNDQLDVAPFCVAPFGSTSTTVSFESSSTASTQETQYTARSVELYSPDSETTIAQGAVPSGAVYTHAGTPESQLILIFIHSYVVSGFPNYCKSHVHLYPLVEQNPVECNKYTISSITATGLTCNRPLTGLSLRLGHAAVHDDNFATCVIPDELEEVRVNYALTTAAGAVGIFQKGHSIYNNDMSTPFYVGIDPNDAVWTFPSPNPRPPYFKMNFNLYLNEGDFSYNAWCRSTLKFNLITPSEASPPLADLCLTKTNQECLNHFQNNTNCVYDFPAATCNSTAIDVCQVHQTSQDCNDNDCLWDSHLDNCLASLAQVNSVFPCSYWNSYATVNANPACSFHGCLYDNLAKKCLNSNETVSTPPVPVVSVDAQFVNPVIDNAELTLSVQAIVPFVYTVSTPTNPRFPVIQVLFPSLDFSAYGTQNIPACSSYQAQDPIAPVSFTTTVEPADLNAYLLNWFAANNNFDFDGSELGQVAAKVLGKARVGSSEVIRNITYDGENLIYNLTLSLPSVTNECSTRGASVNDDAGTRVYIVPLSYIEQSPADRYNQITKSFTVTVPTNGVAAVGSTSAYGFNAFPVSVILTKGDAAGCLEGEAKMQTFYRIESYNVFDPSVRVGLLSVSDTVMRSPDSPPGPTNCYGELFVFPETNNICDYDVGVCTTVVRVSGQCRVLTTDGNAFKQCSYAKDEDRIADLGSDIPYDTALDGLHQFWVYPRVCPLNEGDLQQCRITTSQSSGYPEHVSAIIRPSAYADEAQTANDFQVETGFLPSGSSALANVITGTINDEGVLTYSLGQSGVITIFVAMQQAVRTRFDLRATITTGQTRIIPYSASGLPMSTVSGYTGPAFLSYSAFRARVLATVKDDYFASCGTAGTCITLPACNGIIGCDGFSIPVGQLRAVLPADSYQIVMPYRIGLLNGDGSTPIARRLLQTSSTRIGTATFRFIIDDGGHPVIVPDTHVNGTRVTVDLVSAIAAPDHDKAKLSFYMTSLLLIPLAIIYYVVTVELSKCCSSNK